jgi:hypothetical protein
MASEVQARWENFNQVIGVEDWALSDEDAATYDSKIIAL